MGQKQKKERNTPGTAGGPGGRDRTLAIKSLKRPKKTPFFLKKIKCTPKKYFFLHISSSYAKILGEKLFHTREISRRGSKQKTERKKEKRERKKDQTMVITMAKLCMAHGSTHGARKSLGPMNTL